MLDINFISNPAKHVDTRQQLTLSLVLSTPFNDDDQLAIAAPPSEYHPCRLQC